MLCEMIVIVIVLKAASCHPYSQFFLKRALSAPNSLPIGYAHTTSGVTHFEQVSM